MNNYNVIVIGGGPGGYVCAIKAAQLGLKVALVEKENLGGTCLNWGCIPTKALIRNAEVVNTLKNSADFGIDIVEGGYTVNYGAAHKRSRAVSDRLSRGVGFLMKKNGVEVYNDTAVIADKHKVELKQSAKYIGGDNIVIATGADAIALFDLKPDGKKILLPRQALDLQKLPENAVIIGAGAIGMEFASIWNAYGVDVTVIEALDRVLPKEDADVSKEMENQFIKKGIEVITSSMVSEIVTDDSSVAIKVKKNDGSNLILKKDTVLFALGVRPRINTAGIDKLGLRLEQNAIFVNEMMETSIKSIYAIGDVNGKFPLAHVASAQGLIAAQAIAGFETEEISYTNVPRCTYCFPEVASIGLSEQEAVEKGAEIEVGSFPLSANGKALSLNEESGFVKIISDRVTGEVLGAHMVGAHVTEMVGGLSLATHLESTVEELASVIFPHPTVSESIVEAAHAVAGKAIHF